MTLTGILYLALNPPDPVRRQDNCAPRRHGEREGCTDEAAEYV